MISIEIICPDAAAIPLSPFLRLRLLFRAARNIVFRSFVPPPHQAIFFRKARRGHAGARRTLTIREIIVSPIR
jgi:hypothetical protein